MCITSRILLLTALVLAACGSKSGLSPAAARLAEGSELELTDCEQLERVNGSAGAKDEMAEEHAKNQAREKAAALGATHIRWIVPCCTYVEAATYRCDTPVE